MTTHRTPLDQILASDISDRAFRLYMALLLRNDAEWMPLGDLVQAVRLTSHEARLPLSELFRAGLAEKDRRWESDRKTHITYVRLTDVAPAEAAA